MKERKSLFEKRIHEIDFLRGILILLVLFDHLVWVIGSKNITWLQIQPDNQLFKALSTFAVGYWSISFRDIVRYICLCLFCFLCGVSCVFSKNNKKRSIQLIVIWLIIVIGSNFLHYLNLKYSIIPTMSFAIDLNIIGVLGLTVFLYSLLEKKNWKVFLLVISIAFILHVTTQILLINNVSWFKNAYIPLLFTPDPSVKVLADNMPLVPYLGFVFLGVLFSKAVYEKNRQSIFKHRFEFERPICFLGRNTLIIYLTHYVIIVIIFEFIGLFIH